jgi:hypothetical protein
MRELVDEARQTFDLKHGTRLGQHENRNWDLADWYGDPNSGRNADLGWKAHYA